MEDKIAKIEEKLKLSLFEIEKRLVKLETSKNLEDRVQDIEDLILLLQVEISKLKVLPEAIPEDLRNRLESIEEIIRQKPVIRLEEGEAVKITDIENYYERISELENRLVNMENQPRLQDVEISDAQQSKIGYIEKELSNIDNRLREMEMHTVLPTGATREEEKPSDILNEVKKILGDISDARRY